MSGMSEVDVLLSQQLFDSTWQGVLTIDLVDVIRQVIDQVEDATSRAALVAWIERYGEDDVQVVTIDFSRSKVKRYQTPSEHSLEELLWLKLVQDAESGNEAAQQALADMKAMVMKARQEQAE